MTAKKTKNVPPTKEEDEALRTFMYGDRLRSSISMEERYPDLEESDNSAISTDTNAVIPPLQQKKPKAKKLHQRMNKRKNQSRSLFLFLLVSSHLPTVSAASSVDFH